MKPNYDVYVMRTRATQQYTMNEQITPKELEKLKRLCFSNPSKACAVVQILIDTCQIVSCSTYAKVTGKKKRTINYQASKLTGIEIEGRKFISINQ